MIRAPAKMIHHTDTCGERLATSRLLVEAVPATKIAWLVLREAKTLKNQPENVVAVEVVVVVSLREGLHDLLVKVAGDGFVCPLLKLCDRGGLKARS